MTEPVVAAVEEPVATPAALLPITSPQTAIRYSFLKRNFFILSLLLLTLIGGVMRFAFLDKPPIWFDEAATFARTSATYVELLESLEEAGFGPLHYSAYWWIKNGMPMWGQIETVPMPARARGSEFPRMRAGPRTKNGMVEVRNLKPLKPLIQSGQVSMTPFMMRLIPSICGTLMIPAMYWFARELSGKRNIALIAALLTTFSAYLLNYSRDGKMYMDFWLFCTLHVAALLWWLRTRTMIAWWCWIIAGTVMLGLHLLGLIILVVDLIIVLTAKKPFWRYHLPLVYTPVAAVVVPAEWVGRTTWRFASTRKFAAKHPSHTWQLLARFWRGFHVPALFGFIVGLAIMSIGPYGYYRVFNKYAQSVTERWDKSGLQWIEYYTEGRTPAELVQFSATSFLAGWEWPRRATDLLFLKDGSTVEGAAVRSGRNWKVTKTDGSVVEVANVDVKSRENAQNDEKLIKPSTLKFLKRGCIAVAIVLLMGVFPWRWPWRAKPQAVEDRFTVAHGWRRMLYITLWIVLPAMGAYLISQPAGSMPKLPSESYAAMLRGTAMAQWSVEFINWMKWHPLTASLAGIIAIAGFIVCDRSWVMRLRDLGAIVAIGLIALLLCSAMYDFYPYLDAWLLKVGGRGWRNHRPLWMPRYLGVIIPALFVLTAILISRLPTRYVRGLAMMIFVVVNLYQFGGRVFAGTEPPVDRMVRDTLAWRKSIENDGALKMYYNVRRPGNMAAGLGPGTGVLGMPTARYYWAVYTNSPTHPDEIRGFMGSPIDSRFPPFTSSPNSIKNEVTKNAKINRIIVWDSFDTNKGDGGNDKVLAALGPGWKKVGGGDELFYARDHWTWRDLMTIRRREYTKAPNPPATLPATNPAVAAPTSSPDK